MEYQSIIIPKKFVTLYVDLQKMEKFRLNVAKERLNDFGLNVAKERLKQGLSASELSLRLGKNASYVSGLRKQQNKC